MALARYLHLTCNEHWLEPEDHVSQEGPENLPAVETCMVDVRYAGSYNSSEHAKTATDQGRRY